MGCYFKSVFSRLIEEFMLLANISVAKRIYRAFPDRALLRRHPKPDAKLLDDVVIVYNYNASVTLVLFVQLRQRLAAARKLS